MATDESEVSEEFKRGVRAGAYAMRYYLLDENEEPIAEEFSFDLLRSFEQSAIHEAIEDESRRIALA